MIELTDAEKIAELSAALAAALKPYLQGECYETKNPYSRPYVQQGLKTLGRVAGLSTFGSDWMDVMDKLNQLAEQDKAAP